MLYLLEVEYLSEKCSIVGGKGTSEEENIGKYEIYTCSIL